MSNPAILFSISISDLKYTCTIFLHFNEIMQGSVLDSTDKADSHQQQSYDSTKEGGRDQLRIGSIEGQVSIPGRAAITIEGGD